MKANKYFNPKDKGKRVKDKIMKYYNAVSDDKIKDLIDSMEYSQDALNAILAASEDYIDKMEGDTRSEKFNNLTKAIKLANIQENKDEDN